MEGLRVFPADTGLLVHRAKLLAQDEDPRALQALRLAIPIASDPVPLLAQAAGIVERVGNLRDTAEFLEEAARLKPKDSGTLNHLAAVRSAQGRVAEALDLYDRAVACGPPSTPAGSNRLLAMHYDAEATARRIFAAHRAWASRVEPQAKLIAHAPAVRRNRLRVGYVSGDFRLHAVSYFSAPVLENHDPRRIEVHCFSNSALHDRVTARFRRIAAGWHPIERMNDDQAADCVQRAKIDILVDMSGHSAHNRLRVFARKPAPIQANYLGYPSTTGLKAMDYRFTDSVADPPGLTERFHSETLVRLDPCFLCYQPLLAHLPPGPPPCESLGDVTLACFAIRHKWSPVLLDAWAEILRRARRTRLLLKSYSLCDSEVRREIREFFRERGISPNRVELARWSPTLRDHLLSYRRADLMLDTYPYNGTTMTLEALSRSVPVVTWSGSTFLSRVGASPLRQVGLDDLITTSAGEYVNRTVEAAADPARLAAWRRGLRSRMRSSVLMQPERLARQMEAAYFQMWRA